MAIRLGISLFLLSFWSSINLCGQAVFDTIPRPESIPNASRSLYTFDFDTSGNAWVGFNNNGLGKYDIQTNEWTMYPVDGNLPDYPIQFLAVSYDKVWLIMRDGNAPNVLFFFDGNTFTDYTPLLNGLTVTNMVSSKFDGKVYILTNQGILQPATNEIWNTQNSGLPNDTVYDFTEETPNRIWIGTRNGLAKKEINTWTTYNTSNLNITSNQITDVEATNGNGVWFLANSNIQNGLYQFKNNQLSLNYLTSLADPLNETGGISIGKLIQINSSEVVGFSEQKLISINNGILNSQSFTSEYTNSVFGPYKAKYHNRKQKFWYMPIAGSDMLINYNLGAFFTPGAIQARNVKNLSINQMDIGFGNQGTNFYFWLNGSRPSFEVPKGSGKNANGGAYLSVGAFDENEKLHVSKFDFYYDEFNFQPGPLDTTHCSTNETEMLKYDRLWNLNRWHIEEFQYHFEQGNVQNGSYVPHPDILSWPAHGTPGTNQARNLARFVDVNNNGIYNPIEEGDYPALMGDQTIFTIFNDSTASDANSYMPDLGLEIHQYAYAFTCPENTNQDSILNYTFFMHFDVFNRSNNNYSKMAFGHLQYPYFSTWYPILTGSSPQNNLVYYYTTDTIAESPFEYGPKPPILSTIVLDGPLSEPMDTIDNDNDGIIDEVGEKNLLSYFRTYNGESGSVLGSPFSASDYYNYLTDKWKNGAQMVYGGIGYGTGTPTRHMFPSWPFENEPDSWSELNDGNTPASRNTVLSSGPFNLAAGEKVSLDYAWVFNRNLNYEFNSEPYFLQVESNANIVRNWFEQQNYPTCFDWNLNTPNQKKFENKIMVYPNPTQNEVRISWTNANPINTSISIVDLQGKMMKQIEVNNQSEINLSTQEIPDGFYLVSVCNENGCVTSKLAVIR
jgi:hypothetical protein